MDPRLSGAYGESLAAGHYRAGGYDIEATNFRTRHGEVDIVARQGALLVFVEVKTRSDKALAAPREAVDDRKQQRLLRAAAEYVAAHDCGQDRMRFDVVEVLLHGDASHEIHCIENAFTA